MFFDKFQDAHREHPETYSIYEELRGFGDFKSVIAICSRPPTWACAEVMNVHGRARRH